MYHNSTDMDRRIYRLNKRDLSSAHALVQWCAYKRFCSIVTMSTFVQWCANTHLFNGALMLYAQLFPYFKSMYNCFAIAFLCGILRCDEWTCRCYMYCCQWVGLSAVTNLMVIQLHSPDILDFDPMPAIHRWKGKCKCRRSVCSNSDASNSLRVR